MQLYYHIGAHTPVTAVLMLIGYNATLRYYNYMLDEMTNAEILVITNMEHEKYPDSNI